MTKEEAQQAAMIGKKITHEYFAPHEYVTVTGKVFFDENNWQLDWDDFWNIRNCGRWETGWEIYKP
jgi:hypothetical protein